MIQGNSLFPVFMKLDQIQILLVGGGNVGLEKLEALLKNDPCAKVTIIAPEIREEIQDLSSRHHTIKLMKRAVKHEDLDGIDLLLLATDNPELHKQFKKLASDRNILTNVADTPGLCDFYLGSTVKKGDLKIGISTNGKSPTFAKRFREMLEEELPEDTDELLQNLKGIRDQLKGGFFEKVNELNRITKVLLEKEE